MVEIDMTAVEALHVALQQSFSPDASVRDPAEAAIKNLKNIPGATQMLLHITEEKQVSRGIFIHGELLIEIESYYVNMFIIQSDTRVFPFLYQSTGPV